MWKWCSKKTIAQVLIFVAVACGLTLFWWYGTAEYRYRQNAYAYLDEVEPKIARYFVKHVERDIHCDYAILLWSRLSIAERHQCGHAWSALDALWFLEKRIAQVVEKKIHQEHPKYRERIEQLKEPQRSLYLMSISEDIQKTREFKDQFQRQKGKYQPLYDIWTVRRDILRLTDHPSVPDRYKQLAALQDKLAALLPEKDF